MSDESKNSSAPGAEAEPKSIWFFVGMILSLYGAIILVTGLFGQPPETVLGSTRPAVWWGAVITVAGVIFLKVGWNSGADGDSDA